MGARNTKVKNRVRHDGDFIGERKKGQVKNQGGGTIQVKRCSGHKKMLNWGARKVV